MAKLAGKLRDCDKPGSAGGADLDDLWGEAIRVLTQFCAERPAFWKRPR